MDPRLSLVTLGVADVAVARRFYVDGLGWAPAMEVPGEVVFIQIGYGLLLSLWSADAMAAEAGPVAPHGQGAAPPITLAHNVSSDDDVIRILEQVRWAGGTILVPAGPRDWGGFSGYFADPDGYRWEVACNPGLRVDDDGTVIFAGLPD